MFALTSFVTALGVSAAMASPVIKRQAATTSVMEPPTSSSDMRYTCPTDFSLGYVQQTLTYPDVTVERAYSVLSNWGAALPSVVEAVNATGTGEGANRFWSVVSSEGDVTKRAYGNETLTRVDAVPSNRLEQEWAVEDAVDLATVFVTNYTTLLTLYSNETTNDTSVQLWYNFCADDKGAGLKFFTALTGGYLSGLNTHFTNTSFPVVSA